MARKEMTLAYCWAAQSWGNNYPDGTAQNYLNVKSAYITSPVASDVLYGDANNDGTVDVADVVAIAAYVGNPEKNKLTEQGIINGDVHNSGNGLNANDALAVQQYLANIITKF